MMSWDYQKYVCDEDGCGVKCNTKWTLKRHSAKHQQGSTALYYCRKCNKSFSRKDSLDRHNHMSHSDILLMYMCSEKGCGKLFSLKSTLYRHISSHTGCFKCEECNSSFTRKDNLTRHKSVHTKKKSAHHEKSIETDANANAVIENIPNLLDTMECNETDDDHIYVYSHG
ncbi:zinc finger protein 107-like [Drosophila hydei]|uniref:Zinc finger protein 107-like n=1 Tax=Drosophila hydei TaxID=7224 RepID=A0A6J1LPD8_DROHY|nr:zinc finger protein 107-like [Drosophila hydei]